MGRFGLKSVVCWRIVRLSLHYCCIFLTDLSDADLSAGLMAFIGFASSPRTKV
jgi:hypothetical protein